MLEDLKKFMGMAIIVLTIGAGCKVQQVADQQQAALPPFDIQGHRGARGLMPENTIPAMYKAIDVGVTTLEMDVHITMDKKVILSHDDHINPSYTLNSEGREITKEEAEKLAIYQMDFTRVSTFDVGSKFYDRFPGQQKIKAQIPLLANLIDSVQTYLESTGKMQVFYNIETKLNPSGDNVLHPEPEEFVELLMNVLKQKGITPWVIIQSFDIRTLKVLNKKYPHVRTSYLVEKDSFKVNLKKLGFVPTIYSPKASLITAELIKQVHAQGVKIIPWTVNKKEEIEHLKSLGVDGIISDYPDILTQTD